MFINCIKGMHIKRYRQTDRQTPFSFYDSFKEILRYIFIMAAYCVTLRPICDSKSKTTIKAQKKK